jgi:hypothetical protein
MHMKPAIRKFNESDYFETKEERNNENERIFDQAGNT